MRDLLNSPKINLLKKKQKRILLYKIYFGIFAFAVFLFIFVMLARSSGLNVSDIEVDGNQVVDTDLIKQTAQDQMSGHYLLVFPKTNIFIYPKTQIEQALREKFKRLKNISVNIKNTKILKVAVTEREPKYMWCGNNIPESAANEKCYFTDEDGYIFGTSPFFSGNVYFKFYGITAGDGAGNTDDPSGQIFQPEYFKKLTAFKDNLASINIYPKSMYVGSNNDGEIFLPINKNSLTSPVIKFKINDDLDKVIENLNAALSTEPLKSDFANKYATLLYIDARFGNKVYFKFQ